MTTYTADGGMSVAELFDAVLADTSGEVFVVGFDEERTETLVEVLADLDGPPTVHLLVRESVLKWLRGDFLAASTAADLIDSGDLSLRTSEGPFENTLLVAEESVVAVVAAGDQVGGLVADDSAFVGNVRERWERAYDNAAEFSLRTPPRARVHESLTDELGPEVESDFAAMLAALDTARGDDGLDEVMVSLLAAAKNEVLLYDVSKWGEDVGVASKATFSRTKTTLEERGLIETEKVPIDVGRPRLRLLLGDERLRETDADDLVSVAQGLLSTSA